MFNGFQDKGNQGTNTGSWSPPSLARDARGRWLVVFGSSNPDDSVYTLNAIDGSLVWRFATQQTGGDQDVGAGPTISPPSVNGFHDGMVYIDGKDKIEYALDAVTGSKVWRTPAATGPIFTSPAITGATGDEVLFVGDLTDYEYGYRLSDGALLFTQTVAGKIEASSAVSDGMLFFATTGGYLDAFS